MSGNTEARTRQNQHYEQQRLSSYIGAVTSVQEVSMNQKLTTEAAL